MLRIIQNSAAASAKSYYSTADYYSEGQELVGVWRGKGAKQLGLHSEIQRDAWDALCDNRDPNTGLPLTVRRKQERTVGYDFNFHCPKSVSLLYEFTQDKRLLDAFHQSVDGTMRDMESEMKTRVRTDGRNEDRTTSNMAFGEFIHFTSRPIDGVPDPHLHAHCFVFNTTFDVTENRWKAGQFRDLKRDAPYFEALFHARLARSVAELGLFVDRTKKGWEVAGIIKSTLDKFSRRTALIEETAKEKGITDAKEKSALGAKTRENKQKDLSMNELRRVWLSRLSDDERSVIAGIAARVGGAPIGEDIRSADKAALFATEHCFERKAVVPERELLATALRRSLGETSEKYVERAVKKQNLIMAERDGRRFVTTLAVLDEEKRIIDFARNGRGTSARLGNNAHAFIRDWLNDGQRRAVSHVLGSSDRVILVRGAAGVGKTAMMQEAVEAIEANGKKVFTFAPSTQASRGVLRDEGFSNAETVARLLVDEALQKQVKNQVMWIDEAGLLGTRATAKVFDLADKLNARVILSGDRKQHGSVERGGVLSLLESEAGLVPAEIRDIQRQRGAYKQAVHALSDGRTEDGFDQLDKLGWITEVADTDRHKTLAKDYVAAVAKGKSVLVISPTHLEGQWITHEIRAELKSLGRIDQAERAFRVLENTYMTQAERADAVNYVPGDVLVFHQNAKGYTKGQRVVFGGEQIPVDQAARFQTYHVDTMSIARGDVLRVTQNGKSADGQHRLNNGSTYTVKNFNERGDIVLTNGWTIGKDFGHLAYGYVSTSFGSQGKTVDRVYIGQSCESFRASSREQFYVSVSRAREQAIIYTDDKEALFEAVRRSDDKMTATEFLSNREHRERGVAIQRLQRSAETNREPIPAAPQREEMAYER
jgi:conjugative relaxase-like TrwC/TraI family protein